MYYVIFTYSTYVIRKLNGPRGGKAMVVDSEEVGYLSTAYENLQVTVFRVSICTSKTCLTCP